MREGMEEFDRITFKESSNSGLNWLDADQQKIVKVTLEYVGKGSLFNVELYSQNEIDTKFYLNDGKGDLTMHKINYSIAEKKESVVWQLLLQSSG